VKFILTLNLITLIKYSNDVPLDCLGHLLVVAPGDQAHEVLIESICDLVDGVHCSDQLILLLESDVEDPVGVLAPLALYQIPYPLDGVELAALRRKELVHEPFAIKLVFDNLAVVDAEDVHDHYPLQQGVDPLQLLDEGQEGIDCVGTHKNLSKHKSVLHTQCANHRDALPSLVRKLYLHAFLYPYPRRLHPQVKGGLIYIDDIG